MDHYTISTKFAENPLFGLLAEATVDPKYIAEYMLPE